MTGGRLASVLVSLCLLASGGWMVDAAGQAPSTAVSYNQHVAPIVLARCATCHRPGEVAPMSLLSYSDVRPWARAIKAKVLAREMPPWFADPRFGRFRNERRLSDAEIETIVSWVDAGAPEGAGTPPPTPHFPQNSSGFMDRPPDRVMEMPVDLELPATGEPPYIKLWSKSPFRQDMFLEAVELRPGNRRVAHHSSIGTMPLPRGARLRSGPAWPGGPDVPDALALFGDGRPVADGVMTGNVLVFYVPGGGFMRFREGTARRIRSTDHLLWSLHYMPTGTAERDRHTVALWFARTPPTHEVVTAAASDVHIVNGREILAGDDALLAPIPPRASDYERIGLIAFPEPVTLVALWPHMHAYGRDMTFTAVYPDGREETLLSVPRYDFNWQIQYELEEPLKLPAGTVVRAVAHYDNSNRNPRNRTPDEEVRWGLQSWNEMFGPFLEVVYDNRPIVRRPPPDLFAPDCDPGLGGGVQLPGGGLLGPPCR